VGSKPNYSELGEDEDDDLQINFLEGTEIGKKRPAQHLNSFTAENHQQQR
jgi:hypothetical protein